MRPALWSVLGLLVGLSGCATPQLDEPAADSATYRGDIDAGNNARFFDAIAKRAVRRLVIDSAGGEVEAGIALGSWVYEHGIEVMVEDRCLSACANYVFPAGRNKVIRPGAVVAWHGNYHHLEATGLWRDDIAVRMARTGEDATTAEVRITEQVHHLVALERDFFRRIGVDQLLCWAGKLPPHSVPNYYTLSATDMARYGLVGVQAPADYEKTDFSRFGVAIRFIRLRPSPET